MSKLCLISILLFSFFLISKTFAGNCAGGNFSNLAVTQDMINNTPSLQNTCFNNSTGNNLNFSNKNLTDSSFAGAQFTNPKFDGADLSLSLIHI